MHPPTERVSGETTIVADMERKANLSPALHLCMGFAVGATIERVLNLPCWALSIVLFSAAAFALYGYLRNWRRIVDAAILTSFVAMGGFLLQIESAEAPPPKILDAIERAATTKDETIEIYGELTASPVPALKRDYLDIETHMIRIRG